MCSSDADNVWATPKGNFCKHVNRRTSGHLRLSAGKGPLKGDETEAFQMCYGHVALLNMCYGRDVICSGALRVTTEPHG